MAAIVRSPVRNIVLQHVEDVAVLAGSRRVLLSAPNVKLLHLARADERLAAHVDGMIEAGATGARLCAAALESPSPGAVFAAAALALHDRDTDRLLQLIALAAASPELQQGLLAAFEWADPPQLAGVVARLLESKVPIVRAMGIAACGAHRVDPGLIARRCLDDPDPALRSRALRTAGEQIGRAHV